MAPRIVSSFRRSLSFPNNPSQTSAKPSKSKTRHVRSASLPCGLTHPMASHLRDEVEGLESWSACDSASRTSSWLCDGLNRLKRVHESLDDLLLLPQTRDSLSLRGGARSAEFNLIETFLEAFLQLVDVYGTFQSMVLRLKDECSAAQIAVRRRDDSEIAERSRNLNRTGKEIGKLVADILSTGKQLNTPSVKPSSSAHNDENHELVVEAIDTVIKATVSASSWIFGELSHSSAFRKPSFSTVLTFSRKARSEEGIKEFQAINLENLWSSGKKTEEEAKTVCRKMHELEDCLVEIQGCGDRAFRSLISTRVSLLNVLTQ